MLTVAIGGQRCGRRVTKDRLGSALGPCIERSRHQLSLFDDPRERPNTRIEGGKVNPRAAPVAEDAHALDRSEPVDIHPLPHADCIEKLCAAGTDREHTRIPRIIARDRFGGLDRRTTPVDERDGEPAPAQR